MRTLRGICLIAVFMVSFCFILSPYAQEKKEAEGIYTIKQGDTLWDISAKFFKDPFLWPKLWQKNQYITNPHWIYPGQPVRLSQPEVIKKEEPKQVVAEEKPKEVEVKEKPKAEPPPPPPPPPPVETKPEVVVEVKPVEEKPIGYPEIRSAGFMSEIDYQGIGIVIDNREGKNLMAEGDIIYLAFKTSDPVLVGNRYTLFRGSEIIRHPVTDKKVGRRYNITGNIQIIDHFGSFYTAKVTEAFQAIYKGDLIQPYSKEKMEGVVNQ